MSMTTRAGVRTVNEHQLSSERALLGKASDVALSPRSGSSEGNTLKTLKTEQANEVG